MVIRGRGRAPFYIHTELPHFAKSSDGPAVKLSLDVDLELTNRTRTIKSNYLNYIPSLEEHRLHLKFGLYCLQGMLPSNCSTVS